MSAAGVGLVRVKPQSQRVIFSSQLIPRVEPVRLQGDGAVYRVGVNILGYH